MAVFIVLINMEKLRLKLAIGTLGEHIEEIREKVVRCVRLLAYAVVLVVSIPLKEL